MKKLNKEAHQEEILKSHKTGFGGSDAALVLSFANAKELNATQSKRLKIIANLAEPDEHIETSEMRAGHTFEDYFEIIYNLDEEKINHPISREVTFHDNVEYQGFNVFCHADFFIQNLNTVIELKFSKLSSDEVIKKYNAQLQWYYMLGADSVTLIIGRGTVEPFHVEDIDSIEIKKDCEIIDKLRKGLQNINEKFLPLIKSGSELYKEEGINDTPPAISNAVSKLSELKKLENEICDKIEEQKAAIFEYMQSFSVNKINGNDIKINYIADSVTTVFDKKKLFDQHKELKESDYQKTTNKKGYLKIELINDKN